MTLRALALTLIAAIVAGLPARALCAEPPTLAPDKAKVAACMLSVVEAQRNVSDAKLSVEAGTDLAGAPAGPARAFIDYTFNHRFDGSGVLHTHVISKTPMHEEITRFLPPMAEPNIVFLLSGISPMRTPPEGWTNDHNNGLWDILPTWRRTCGVPIGVGTV